MRTFVPRSLGGGLIAALVLFLCRGAAASNSQSTNSPPRYSFRETVVMEKLDSDNRVKSSTTMVREVSPVDGFLFARLVSRGGKALSPKEEKAEAQRLERFRAAIREGKKPKQDPETFDPVRNDFTDMQNEAGPEGMSIEKGGQENVNDRSCDIYHFSGIGPGAAIRTNELAPKLDSSTEMKEPDVQQKREFGQEMMKSIQGKVWVDEEDKSPARLDIWLKEPVHFSWHMMTIRKIDFHVDFRRLEPKLWMPETATAMIRIRAFLLVDYNLKMKMTRDDFREVGPPTGHP